MPLTITSQNKFSKDQVIFSVLEITQREKIKINQRKKIKTVELFQNEVHIKSQSTTQIQETALFL